MKWAGKLKAFMMIAVATSNIIGGEMTQEAENAIKYCNQKWALENVQPIMYDRFIDGNYLATAYSRVHKQKCVLKIASTDLDHQERRALQYFAGMTKASVQLLDYDDQYHAVLLQYLSGPLLESFFPERDGQAIEVIVNLVKSFHPKPCTPDQLAQFKVSQLARIQWCLDNPDSTKIPRDLLVKAQELYEMLLRTQNKLYVLHGDFHHCNILWDDSSSSWIAVDPRGIVGELEAEVTPFIVNPIPELLAQENGPEIIKCRIDRFVEAFDLDRQRLYQWLFVLPVHGACWGEEDGHNSVEYFVRFARLMEKFV